MNKTIKLTLTRETLRQLDDAQIQQIQGGGGRGNSYFTICPGCDTSVRYTPQCPQ